MADIAGYYFFGGGVDDYARAYGTDTLLVNTDLVISDPATSATLTDLLDGSGSTDSTITTDAHGEFKFYARIPVVNVTPVGGGTYQVISKSALAAAANVGNLASQVSAANAAAAAAASAASAAQTAASQAIPAALEGAPSGVATLDATGHLNYSQSPQTVLDRLDSLEAGAGGGSVGAREHQIFQFSTTATPPSLVSGVPGGEWVSPAVDTLLDSIYMALDDYHATQDATFDVQVNPPPYAGFTSCYAGTLPKVPAGSVSAFGIAAPSPAVPAHSLLRVVPTNVPPAASGSATPAALKGTQTTYDTGTSTASSHAIPLPAGGAVGDVVLVALAGPGGSTHSMPAGWTKLLDQIEPGGNNRVRLTVWGAPWASGLVPTVTTSSGTSACGWGRLISGADLNTIVAVGAGIYQGGQSVSGVSGTAPVAADLLIELNGVDIPNPLTVVTTQTWTAGPPGQTKDWDDHTTRTTIRNNAIGVGHASGVAAGATIAAPTYVLGGAASNTSWAFGLLYIPRAAGTHGPTRARVQVDLVAS